MDKILNILKYCYCEEEDSFFCYSLLKNKNLYYLYYENNKYYLHPVNINTEPKKNNIKINIKFDNDVQNLLLEGLVLDNKFFTIDILYINNNCINENYFTRYNILKELINTKLDKNENTNISIIKIYYNYSLQTLLSYINTLQGNQVKPSYIYMKKNFNKYLINIDTSIIKENNRYLENKIIFHRKISNTEWKHKLKKEQKFEIYKTNKTEIYVAKLDSYNYLILTIKSLEKANEIFNKFENSEKNYIEELCVYSSNFDSYCI